MTEFKGLTIRIGADTAGLKRSLRSANGAIRDTQSALRKLDKAARLDPSNMKVLEQRTQAVRGQAKALTERLSLMQNALGEIKRNPAMAELAKDTENAALRARHAGERYAEICARIKEFKNQLATAAGYDVAKNDPFKGYEGVEQTVARMKELGLYTQDAARKYDALVKKWGALSREKAVEEKRAEIAKLKDDIAVAGAEAKALYRQLAMLAVQNPAATTTKAFRKLREEVGLADAASKQLREQLRAMDSALKLDPSNLIAARERMGLLQEQARIAGDRLKVLSAQMRELKAAGADKAEAQFRDLAAEIERTKERDASLNAELEETRSRLAQLKGAKALHATSEEARELEQRERALNAELAETRQRLNLLGEAQAFRKVRQDIAATVSEMTALNAKMQQGKSKMTAMNGSLQQFGWSAYATVTPLVLMFAHKAIQSAEDIDAAYRNMRKTVQGTEKQFEALRRSAIEYSRTHYTSADQLLEIEAIGGQLGVATEKLESFARTVSNIDIATDLDVDTAATQLGQLQGILSDFNEDDFPRFSDALVRLGNNSATMESRIMNVTTRIGSMGSITGFTTPQLLALATAVASTGQGAESAGTAISKTMSDIESAVGGGGDKLKKFAEVAGMSASEFATTWKNEPIAAFEAFIKGLKRVEEAGGSADSTLKELKINSVRQKQAILGLMQTVDGLGDSLKMSENAWNGVSDEWGMAGDAAREADAKCQGFSGAIQLLRNNAEVLGAEFGDSLAPEIRDLAGIVAALTKAFSDMPPLGKKVVAALVGATAAVGPTTIAFNAVTRAVGSFRDIHSTATNAVTKVAKACRSSIATFQAQAQSAAMAAGAVEQTGIKAKLSAAGMTMASGAAKVLKVSLQGIALLAVAAFVTDLASRLGDLKERQERASESSRKLGEAMGYMSERTKASYQEQEEASRSTKEIIDACDACSEATLQMANEISSSWSEVRTSQAKADHYLRIIRELQDKSGLTAAEQQKLRMAVKAYNDETGSSIEITDALNGTLSVTKKELEDSAKAWKRNAEAQAYEESYKKGLEQEIALKQELEEVTKKKNELMSQEAGYNEHLGTTYQRDAEEIRRLAEREKDLTDQLNDVHAVTAYAERAMEGLAQETSDAAQSTAELTEQQQELASGLEELLVPLDALVASTPLLQQALDGAGMSVEQLAAYIQGSGMTFDEFESGIHSGAEGIWNAFERIETKSDMTFKKMLDNLKHNLEATKNWHGNLDVLYDAAGDDFREYVDYLAEQGPEFSGVLQEMVDDLANGGTKFSEFCKSMEDGFSEATRWSVSEMKRLPPEARAAAEDAMAAYDQSLQAAEPQVSSSAAMVVDAVTGEFITVDESVAKYASGVPTSVADSITNPQGIARVRMASKKLSDAASDGASGMPDAFGSIAADSGDALVSDMGLYDPVVRNAANSWYNQATGQLKPLPAEMGRYGKNGGGNLNSGLADGNRLIASTIRSTVSYIKQADLSGQTYSWGQHAIQNLASGIRKGNIGLNDAVKQSAAIIASYTKHSVAEKGPLHNGGKGEKPWGRHVIENLIEGMRSARRDLEREMDSVSDIIAGTFGKDGRSLQVRAVADYKARVDASTIAAAKSAASAIESSSAMHAEAVASGNAAIAAGLAELSYKLDEMMDKMPREMAAAMPDGIKVEKRTFARLVSETKGTI